MIQINGNYFVKGTSQKQQSSFFFYPSGDIFIDIDNAQRPIGSTIDNISPRVGSSARYIRFANGAKIESFDNDAIDQIASRFSSNPGHEILYLLESKMKLIIIMSILVIGIVVSGITHGIPFLANKAAVAIPKSINNSLGRGTLELLDKLYFETSNLKQEQRELLLNEFKNMSEELQVEQTLILHFRNGSSMGANAFSLPSGDIIVTDQLVELADNNQQIISVLAHEIGHVVERHSLRQVLQSMSIVVLVSIMSGDVGTASSLTASLPTLLIQANYSRSFETEADQFAIEYLRKKNIPEKAFSTMLLKLENSHSSDDTLSFLSSHPMTKQRIKNTESN